MAPSLRYQGENIEATFERPVAVSAARSLLSAAVAPKSPRLDSESAAFLASARTAYTFREQRGLVIGRGRSKSERQGRKGSHGEKIYLKFKSGTTDHPPKTT